jgi:hypothetical protein
MLAGGGAKKLERAKSAARRRHDFAKLLIFQSFNSAPFGTVVPLLHAQSSILFTDGGFSQRRELRRLRTTQRGVSLLPGASAFGQDSRRGGHLGPAQGDGLKVKPDTSSCHSDTGKEFREDAPVTRSGCRSGSATRTSRTGRPARRQDQLPAADTLWDAFRAHPTPFDTNSSWVSVCRFA